MACWEEYDERQQAKYCCGDGVDTNYQCNNCNEVYPSEEGANTCCNVVTTCGICLKEHRTTQDAVDCCMHTHPSMGKENRYKLVKLLEDGMSWLEAYHEVLK